MRPKAGDPAPGVHAERLAALQQIAVELMASKDLSSILKNIVEKSVDLLECDAGSLFVKGEDDTLSFEVAINRSIQFEFKKARVPLGGKGLAAWTFRTGNSLIINDVEKIPSDAPYEFNGTIDTKTGYRTRSVLMQPLKSSKGDVLGVLQLVNRKTHRSMIWPSSDLNAISRMPSFNQEDSEFLKSFAAVASAALENAKLYTEIENLFEGFVTASVHAIEARDLATRGHSDRVAALTVELAKQVSRSQDPEVREISYNENQIAEIRYAALLHDFGKIGVREATLLKEEKLSPLQKVRIKSRFDGFKYSAEIQVLKTYIESLIRDQKSPTEFEYLSIQKDIKNFGSEIEKYWEAVMDLNKPTILNTERSEHLELLSRVHCKDCHGVEQPLLDKEEIFALKITKGSLTEAERLEIESHVVHTFEFLKKIPWTKNLAKVPEIAAGHHERLNGRGYPYQLVGEAICPQARMMAICDIFDALVASDRPYKASLPTEKALEILSMQARAKDLDPSLFKVFIEARVFENPEFKSLLTPVGLAQKNRKAA